MVKTASTPRKLTESHLPKSTSWDLRRLVPGFRSTIPGEYSACCWSLLAFQGIYDNPGSPKTMDIIKPQSENPTKIIYLNNREFKSSNIGAYHFNRIWHPGIISLIFHNLDLLATWETRKDDLLWRGWFVKEDLFRQNNKTLKNVCVKVRFILPNGGLMVVYHGTICKESPEINRRHVWLLRPLFICCCRFLPQRFSGEAFPRAQVEAGL